MPSASNMQARVLARISESANQLTVHFQVSRTIPTGVAPGVAPLNPLGAVTTPTLLTPDPVPSRSPVTIQCLWMEANALSDAPRSIRQMSDYGWRADADATARVSATDAVDGVGKTIFDNPEFVEMDGRHFTVLSIVPIGSSFSKPYSYQIWFKGRKRQ